MPKEALKATQEALAIYRVLAQASPGRYQAELAVSTANLSVRFSELEDAGGGTAARREGRRHPPRPGSGSSGRFRPRLASSLDGLGFRLWSLVSALSHLGICHWALRQSAQALPVTLGSGQHPP